MENCVPWRVSIVQRRVARGGARRRGGVQRRMAVSVRSGHRWRFMSPSDMRTTNSYNLHDKKYLYSVFNIVPPKGTLDTIFFTDLRNRKRLIKIET